MSSPQYTPGIQDGADERASITDERSESSILKHRHDGVSSERIDLFYLAGMLQTFSSAPTHVPKRLVDQIILYESGATRRLYVYVNGTWRYVALT